MTRSGRPLRFLGITMAGWTALRIVMLWPPVASVVPRLRASAPHPAPVMLALRLSPPPPVALPPRSAARRHMRVSGPATAQDDGDRDSRVALALAALLRFGEPQLAAGPPGAMIAPPRLAQKPASAPTPSRWSADLWVVARGGGGRQTGFGGGRLGGAQAGARFAYALDRDRRLAAFARIDTPLSGHGREAAIGLDWRPTPLPVRAVVEQRMPLDGGAAAPAAGLVGGFGPVLRHGVRLEGYGQAGVIARHGGEGFADGAVRATKPVGRLAGLTFDLGAGAWGGAQSDAARLDLGPTLGASIPLGNHAIRVALDWRERVAGEARPGSGPALTLGASF